MLIFFIVLCLVICVNSELQLVHVLFRHGERTTDTKTLYPKDPHVNETYYPHGPGELTIKGKQREFKLGKTLRQRYDQFLGPMYTPDILEAWSSNINRTKNSLQLVLAGLFPPTQEQIWETGLNWQPIPFNALPIKKDNLFLGFFCPKFKKLLAEVINSPKMRREFTNYDTELKYISENSGLNVKSYWDLFYLYMCLTTEKEYGLKLPQWTEKVYPQPLQYFAIKSYGLLTSTTEMKRIAIGGLLKKIVDDSKAKVENLFASKNRKIFLYSGHEVNIAHMLQTLDVFQPHIPPYGCYILFELHKLNGTYGFRIYYQDFSTPEPKPIKLPGCDEFCPLSQFISLVEEYFPETDSCESTPV